MKQINMLQFGIDLGRALAHTQHASNPVELRATAQAVVDVLGIDVVVDNEPALLLGLGWGVSSRRQTPIEQEAREVIGLKE